MAGGIKTSIQLMDNMTTPLMSVQHGVGGLIGAFQTLQANANIDASSLTQMQNLIAMADSSVRVLGDSYQILADQMHSAEDAQDDINTSIQQGVTDADNLVSKFGMAAAAYAAINTGKKVIGLSDELTSTTARLNNMNDGLQTADELQQMIFQSAQRSRSAYTETAATVSRLGILAGKAFKNNKETVAFAEQMNKQFVVGGASIQEQTQAMRQLTQAMASGRLRGDELVSISENAPLLKQALEDAMTPLMMDEDGKVKGTFQEWASAGLVTADVIKYALFSVAEETNAKFEQMPLTWGQLWTTASNNLIMAFQPALEWIGGMAGWISESWGRIEPVIYGVATAIGAYVAAQILAAAKTWATTAAMTGQGAAAFVYNVAMGLGALAAGNAALAQTAFNAALNACPFMFIVTLIGLVVMAIVKWVKAVGGLRVAWLIVVNALMTAWDWLKIGFMTGINFVSDLLYKLNIVFAKVGFSIINYIGDMKTNALMLLQALVNGAIDIINDFIGVLNKIPGVNIGLIGQVTFGTEAFIKNETAKMVREAALAQYENDMNAKIAENAARLAAMKDDARAATVERLAGIEAARAENAAKEEAGSGFDYDAEPPTIVENTAATAANTAKTADYSEEELKLWRDIAERDTINRFTTAEVTVDFGGITNNVASNMDLDGIVNYISDGIEETLSVVAKGVYA